MFIIENFYYVSSLKIHPLEEDDIFMDGARLLYLGTAFIHVTLKLNNDEIIIGRYDDDVSRYGDSDILFKPELMHKLGLKFSIRSYSQFGTPTIDLIVKYNKIINGCQKMSEARLCAFWTDRSEDIKQLIELLDKLYKFYLLDGMDIAGQLRKIIESHKVFEFNSRLTKHTDMLISHIKSNILNDEELLALELL